MRTWLIDQWRQVGLDQKVDATGPFYAALNSGSFDVTLDTSIVNRWSIR